MKTSKATKKAAEDLVDQAIRETQDEVAACGTALQKGCSHALRAGMRLIWLHRETAQDPHGYRVSRETRVGFGEAVLKIGLRRATAYRWMNAAAHGCERLCLCEAGAVMEVLPAVGSPELKIWDVAMGKLAEQTTLNRLVLGFSEGGNDVHRLSELTDAVEEGRVRAVELLEAVECGRYTLAQAVRALGSQEAYDRLRAEGGEKVRRDAVYLEFDFVKKLPTGLVPKALTTLRNGFEGWADYDDRARAGVRVLWRDMLAAVPPELLRELGL